MLLMHIFTVFNSVLVFGNKYLLETNLRARFGSNEVSELVLSWSEEW